MLHQLLYERILIAAVGLTLAMPGAVVAQTIPSQADKPAATAHPANDIAGSWQGTLERPATASAPGERSRLVIAITKPESGGWSAVVVNIDQGARRMNAAAMTLQGSSLKFTVPAISYSFEGTISPDGAAISGRWIRGAEGGPPGAPPTLPLTLVRTTRETAWEIPAPPAPPKPMAADADPSFAVATIKPNNSGTAGKSNRINGRHFTTQNTTMAYLLAFAYRLHENQLINAPQWFDQEKWDVDAVQEGEGAPSDPQWRVMLQKLLADRLKLTFHRETRPLSIYVLSVGKGGPKDLTKSLSEMGLPGFGLSMGSGGMIANAHNSTLTEFSNMVLQGEVLDRPVLDQTNLTGRFDFHVAFLPDESMFHGHPPPIPPSTTDNPAPSLFTAMQEQLGLKLEPVKGPAQVIVIDHVERPSQN
jgi:uncharacterized protein (TIGR03435 family)